MKTYKIKARSIRSVERIPIYRPIITDSFHEAKDRGGDDVRIMNAKGGVFLKAKKKAGAVLKEFVGRKMRMRVENNNIILQEVD